MKARIRSSLSLGLMLILVAVCLHTNSYADENAWIGYVTGNVRFCRVEESGSGGSAPPDAGCFDVTGGPLLTEVTAISAAGKLGDAWIGYATGTVRYCRAEESGSGGSAMPKMKCVDVAGGPLQTKVTAISATERFRDAWIGYVKGRVRYCTAEESGSGGSAILRTKCVDVSGGPLTDVTAISATEQFRDAWIGYVNGRVRHCRAEASGSGGSIALSAKCVDVTGGPLTDVTTISATGKLGDTIEPPSHMRFE